MDKSTRIKPVRLQDADARLNEDILEHAYRRNPHAPVKELQKGAGCGYRTAESWWGRKTSPGKKHLLRLMRSWGRPFIAIVLSSVDEDLAAMAHLKAETDALRREHKRLLKAYEQAFSKD